MYAITSTLFVRRTLATLRSAEFGFLGVVVYTRVQTPRRCGQFDNAGDFVFFTFGCRPFRTNCCIVGTLYLFFIDLLAPLKDPSKQEAPFFSQKRMILFF